VEDLDLGLGNGVDAELEENLAQQIGRRQARIDHDRDVIGILGELSHHTARDHRLAAADLPREHERALALVDAVRQPLQRLTMARREVKELGIGCVLERVAAEVPEFLVHRAQRSLPAATDRCSDVASYLMASCGNEKSYR